MRSSLPWLMPWWMLVSTVAAMRDVEMHVVTDGGHPTLTLYSIAERESGVEFPSPRTFVPSFGDPSTEKSRDYYVGGYLIPTDMSFGRRSSLWLWWSGYELDGRFLTLQNGRGDAGTGAYAGTTSCFDAGDYSCIFTASGRLTDDTGAVLAQGVYNVSVFSSGDSTLLPPALFSDVVDAALVVTWAGGALHIDGPFVLGKRQQGIVLSHAVRNDYTFRYEHGNGLFMRERNTINTRNMLVDFTLTLLLLYAVAVLLSTWTLDCVRYVFVLPLAMLPFLFIGTSLRFFILVYLATRTIVGIFKPAVRVSVEYCALETMWTLTMVLHTEQVNITSAMVKSLLLSVALRDMQIALQRCGPRRLSFLTTIDSLLVLLLSASFINDDMMPLIRLEFGARYGLLPLLPAAFIALLLLEVSVHLR